MKQSFVIIFLCLVTFMQRSFAQTAPPCGFSIDAIRPSNCTTTDGSLTVLPIRGTSPFTYNWSTGSTNISISNITAGTYTVTVTDATGCTSSATRQLAASYMDVLVTAQHDDTRCPNNLSNGFITVDCPNGIAPLSFVWSNGQTTQTATGLSAGTYSVTVTDANGCEGYTSSIIHLANSWPYTYGLLISQPSINCGNSTAEAIGIFHGGVSPVSYQWSNGQTSQTAIGLSLNTTYNVTATDALGCTASNSIQTIPNSISSNIEYAGACNGVNGMAQITYIYGGIPPYTYNWSNGATGVAVTGLTTGNHTVTITDSNGCQGVSNVSISNASMSVYNQTPSCSQLGRASAYLYSIYGLTATYLWDNGETTSTATALSTGVNHSVTATTSSGCVFIGNVNIPVTNPPLNISLVVDQPDANCLTNQTGSAHVVVTGGIPNVTPIITWNGGGASLPQGTTVSNLGAANYTVQVYQSTGNLYCSEGQNFVINDVSGTSLTYTVIDADCGAANGAILASAMGFSNPTYQWGSGESTPAIGNLIGGTYHELLVSQAGTNCQLGFGVVIGDSLCNRSILGNVVNNTTCTLSGSTPQPFIPVRGTFNYNNGLGTQETLAFTDNTGHYRLPIPFDTVAVSLPNLPSAATVLCPSNGVYNIDGSLVSSNLYNNNFYIYPNNAQDFRTYMVSLRNPRPGYPNSLRIYVHNDGTVNTGSVHLTHDMLLSGMHWFTNQPTAGITLTSYDALTGEAVWNFNNLNAGEEAFIQIDFDQLATNAAFGNFTNQAVAVENISADLTPGNNSNTLRSTITASYDPNSVEVHPFRNGSEQAGEVYGSDHDLTYTIHFQNMGNAEANNVIVVDEIDGLLDFATITNVVTSHPDNLRLSVDEGKLVARFANINLPALSTDEAGSMGFIQFQISRTNHADLPFGATLYNQASIYFDYNEAVVTNRASTHVIAPDAVNEVPVASLGFAVVPNPANDNVTINYHLGKSENVSVYIYNAVGALTTVVTEGETQSQGDNTRSIDLSNLSAGTYFIQLKTASHNQIQKVIKL